MNLMTQEEIGGEGKRTEGWTLEMQHWRARQMKRTTRRMSEEWLVSREARQLSVAEAKRWSHEEGETWGESCLKAVVTLEHHLRGVPGQCTIEGLGSFWLLKEKETEEWGKARRMRGQSLEKRQVKAETGEPSRNWRKRRAAGSLSPAFLPSMQSWDQGREPEQDAKWLPDAKVLRGSC